MGKYVKEKRKMRKKEGLNAAVCSHIFIFSFKGSQPREADLVRSAMFIPR